VIYWDTKAREQERPGVVHLLWRCGVTVSEIREDDGWGMPEYQTWTDPLPMWQAITEFTSNRSRTLLVGHNAGFGLRVSGALRYLPALGYEPDARPIFTDRVCSIGWHGPDGRSLLMVDSFSYLPTSIEDLRHKLSLPRLKPLTAGDTDEAWLERSRADAEVVRLGVRSIIDLMADQDLGNFARTGPGCAWNEFRHKHLTDEVIVHGEAEVLEVERSSILSGRCEAWQHGQLGARDEWDLPMAYPRAALDNDLPCRLIGRSFGPAPARAGQRALCRATVTLDVPVLPYQDESGIYWPIGTFSGWWWDCELALADAYGARIAIEETWHYAAAPVLDDWARWIIWAVEDPSSPMTGVQRFALKHWSRALIGKFGSRTASWHDAGHTTDELAYETLIDPDYGVGELMTVAGRRLVSWKREYTADACPAIMAAIIAETRIRLWQLTQIAGEQSVAYMDTDSLFTDAAGSRRLRAWVSSGAGWGIRVKKHHRSVEVLGPRKIVLEDSLKVSGLPKRAHRTSKPGEYSGEIFESLRGSARAGRSDAIQVTQRTWHLTPSDARRMHLDNGRTAPREVGIPS
jgi:hypothetical protein